MKKIFIDAGHNFSGFGTGAVGNGLKEQNITFEVASKVSKILREHGLSVMESRPTLQTNLGRDNASSVNERWQMSNKWGADYFVSIHVNAGGGTGAETLYSRPHALELAQTVQNSFSNNMGLRNRRVWLREDLGVLRHTKCPAILIELAFIDSPPHNPDAEILRNKQPEMATALAKAILDYLNISANINNPTTPTPSEPKNTPNGLYSKGRLLNQKNSKAERTFAAKAHINRQSQSKAGKAKSRRRILANQCRMSIVAKKTQRRTRLLYISQTRIAILNLILRGIMPCETTQPKAA
jgi:N-acetylmuramoyl-L-alanine amidase